MKIQAEKSVFLLPLLIFVGISCEEKIEKPIPLKEPIPATYNLEFITELDREVKESSALSFFNDALWTINDKGNENILYQLDAINGSILKKVRISNAENIDWESMAQSTDHIYIGDFGNNDGNRKDLAILKVKKSDLLALEEVIAEKIFFSYPEQTNFDPPSQNHNFDCEAFFFANNQFHLFTKNWADNQTNYYTVPDIPGNQTADLKKIFDTSGLITAADINISNGVIILLGYTNSGTNSQSFLWLLSDYPSFNIFSGEKNKIILGNVRELGQTEGIYFKEDNVGWVTSEEISLGPLRVTPKLFRFNFKTYF
ncbi:hypothetical protein [Shivajiella indica]|uniref:T9SS C-terminal target domain-containing protein n=1 Tax=Shivajiella indica TaxID=872115 RepID=A0ABW5B3L8_9BACT